MERLPYQVRRLGRRALKLPQNADQFGLCVLVEEGECQLASLTGFRWNAFVAWMQGVASLWESTVKLCWRANQASKKKNPSSGASHA
jgi:hypothetical protein